MTCCVRCPNKDVCPKSTVFMPKEDTSTVKKALAIKELGRRLNLSPEFIIDHLSEISEILEWKPRNAVIYP